MDKTNRQVTLPVTPDGVFYIRAAQGKSVPIPYALRTIVPVVAARLGGDGDGFWKWAHGIGMALLAICTAIYAESVFAIPLVLLGPAMWFYWKRKVLTDIPAMGLMMAGVVTMQWAPWVGSVLIVLGTLFNEKVPIFSALLLWSPLPLMALVIPAILYLMHREDKWEMPEQFGQDLIDTMGFVLKGPPWKVGWQTHKDTLGDPTKWLLPLGGLLFAFFAPTQAGMLALLVALGMAFLATDSVRMYTWATPALTFSVCSLGWPLVILAIAVQWFAHNNRSVRQWV